MFFIYIIHHYPWNIQAIQHMCVYIYLYIYLLILYIFIYIYIQWGRTATKPEMLVFDTTKALPELGLCSQESMHWAETSAAWDWRTGSVQWHFNIFRYIYIFVYFYIFTCSLDIYIYILFLRMHKNISIIFTYVYIYENISTCIDLKCQLYNTLHKDIHTCIL